MHHTPDENHSVLHRNQAQLDAIRDALVKADLLTPEQANDLIFHLGDTLDSAHDFPKDVERVFSNLDQLRTNPDEFEIRLGEPHVAIEHFAFHMFGAVLPLQEAQSMLSIDNMKDEEDSEETDEPDV